MSTNVRVSAKRCHCSSVNWSRTEKKSVPRASPSSVYGVVGAVMIAGPSPSTET